MKAKQIIANLSNQDVIDIMEKLGANKYDEKNDYIIFPTICHNLDTDNASMKLYYYKDSKLFHCFTECQSSFNIFGLIKLVFELRGLTYTFYDDIYPLVTGSTINQEDYSNTDYYYESIITPNKYNKKVTLKIFSKNILDCFTKIYPIEWIEEGISKNTMDVFNIYFSILDNKIIIPHYDMDNNLIGIRGRSLNEKDILSGRKYMPIEIDGVWYSHPTSMNIYGLNVVMNNKNCFPKKIVLFEGEKSCMKYYDLFENNISGAICGNNISKFQVNQLVDKGVEEIIIALDKEFDKSGTKESLNYFNKMYSMCKKYSNYCNISFIYDDMNLLEKKDSPIDKGKESFIKLYSNRVMVEDK